MSEVRARGPEHESLLPYWPSCLIPHGWGPREYIPIITLSQFYESTVTRTQRKLPVGHQPAKPGRLQEWDMGSGLGKCVRGQAHAGSQTGGGAELQRE